jgi:hypothetical protein
MRRFELFVVVTLIALSAVPAIAREKGEMRIRAFGGLVLYSVDEPEGVSVSSIKDLTIGGAFDYSFGSRMSLEGELAWSNPGDYDITIEDLQGQGTAEWRNPSANILMVHGNFNVYMTDGTTTPFVGAGLGFTRFGKISSEIRDGTLNGVTRPFETPEVPASTDFSLNAGVGMDFGAIRAEYRHFFVFQEGSTGTLARFTAGFNFGPL